MRARPGDAGAGCATDTDPASPTFGHGYCAVYDVAAPPGATCTGPNHQQSPATPHQTNCDSTVGSCVLLSAGATSGVCTVFLDAGDACFEDSMHPICPPGAPCINPDGVDQGTCTPLATAGMPCAGIGCVAGLFCDERRRGCARLKSRWASRATDMTSARGARSAQARSCSATAA